MAGLKRPLVNRRGEPLYGLDPLRVADSKLAGVLERELRKRTDPDRLRRSLGDLKKGRVFRPQANTAANRLGALLAEMPRATVAKGVARRRRYDHLFDAPEDTRSYLRSTEELRALLKSGEGRQLLRSAAGRQMLEQHAQALVQQIADVTDRYLVLEVETGLFNELVGMLYPKDYPSLRLDAHHVIEQRAFELFRKDWASLGWTKPQDMVAIPVFYEFHIRSPKRLPVLRKLGEELDARSLSKELFKQVDPKRAGDVFALLKAYKAYYAKGGLTRAIPVLEAIENELSRRRSAARIVKEVKKLQR